MKKIFLIFLFFILCNIFVFSESLNKNKYLSTEFKIEFLKLFEKAYPQVQFKKSFDKKVDDWKIEISVNDKTQILYWADAKFLPLEELFQKELYSSLLYHYPKEVPNPKDFTQEDIERIKNFSNPKNRTSGKGTPQFLYNLIYDIETRAKTEQHIKSFIFLNRKSNPHEAIHKKLNDVQKDIFVQAKTNIEVNSFLEKLDSADSYAWRVISDSGNRSVHSMGLAIDVLPKGWQQKNLYWAWRRDIDPQNWMLLDLDRRWMPPQKVIEIFESHGFIWGGKWIIWDNMHFEYRPEVILFNQ